MIASVSKGLAARQFEFSTENSWPAVNFPCANVNLEIFFLVLDYRLRESTSSNPKGIG